MRKLSVTSLPPPTMTTYSSIDFAPKSRNESLRQIRPHRPLAILVAVTAVVGFATFLIQQHQKTTSMGSYLPATLRIDGVPLEGLSWEPDPTMERCDFVVDIFESKNRGLPRHEIAESYSKQCVDANVFYRATASIFWQDFVAHGWDDQIYALLDIDDHLEITDKSTWTFVTGDQHLSNFGAWRNRHNKVVFSVNDFDEAAIYDFHIDLLRLAVSIFNHATVNGLSDWHIKKVMKAFTNKYLETVLSYVGNEDALTFELTEETAEGVLEKFLKTVDSDNSHKSQLEKFTDLNGSFLRNNVTRLVSVQPEIEQEMHRAFSSTQYRATMMKTGWHVPVWNAEYFAIRDVARRLGSGIGSYGVDRYYVLLNGTDHQHIILDVKYEPAGGVSLVLSDDDKAWYAVMFRNEAARAVEAQRRLTSYVDPFTGWAMIQGNAFVVRQRSPWKKSPDLSKLDDYHDFKTFAEMVAIATATAHTRGTPAKAPGEFKQVIKSILGYSHKAKIIWGKAVSKIAESYAEQVKLDYQCFRDYVEVKYPEAIAMQNMDDD